MVLGYWFSVLSSWCFVMRFSMPRCLLVTACFVALPGAAAAVELNRPAEDSPAAAKVPGAAPPAVVRLSHCLVSLIDDVEVPAEKAGVLTTFDVREGDYLQADALIATIDQEQARHQYEAARAESEAARKKATSELEVDYAVATHRTADAEHKIALSANAKQPNAVSVVEIEKLRLAAEQAAIKIGVTRFERELKAVEARGFESKAALAETDLRQRRIAAPLAGEVVEVFQRAGEWVEPGKPLVRLVRLDRLRVEGFVRFDVHAPARLAGRPVRAVVTMAGGKSETFVGRVTFISPLVQPGGEYRFWAEVDNRRDGDAWLLRPGVEAELVIEMKDEG